MFRTFKYILFLMAVVLLSACHTSRRAADLKGTNPEKARFEAVVQGGYKFDALQSKVRLSMGKTSLNGKICIEQGKRFALMANAPLLGFEVFRIEATAEELLLVDKMDKLYCSIPFDQLTAIPALADHGLEALECLVLGRIFIPGKGLAVADDYSRLAWDTALRVDGSTGNSTGTFDGGNYSLAYVINNQGQLVSTTLTLADGQEATFYYDVIEEVSSKRHVPTQENLKLRVGEKTLSAGLSMTNPSFGTSSWKAFEPASSYRKVEFNELVDVIKLLM